MSTLESFYTAIKQENLDDVKNLVREEYINKVNRRCTALHWACWYNKKCDIAEYLLDYGWNINAVAPGWKAGDSEAVHFAAGFGNVATLELLIKRGCSFDHKNSSGYNPLETTLNPGYLERLQRLRKTMTGDNAIITQLNDGQVKCAQILWSAMKADSDLRNITKTSSNEIRAWLTTDNEDHRKMLEALLYRCICGDDQTGFNILSTPDLVNRSKLCNDMSALELASKINKVVFVNQILRRMMNNDETWDRASALAKKNGSIDIVEAIAERRKDLNNQKENYTRLQIAIIETDSLMVEYILRTENYELDDGDANLSTALNMAYDKGDAKYAKEFFDYSMTVYKRMENDREHLNENIELKNFMGFTPLQLSVLSNSVNICEQLLKKTFDRAVHIDPRFRKPDQNLTVMLSKTCRIMITEVETLCTLCVKVNNTIYPCLLETIDQHSVDETDESGNTLLHMCAVFLLWDMCTQLLQRGAHANITNLIGETPLLKLLKENRGEDIIKINETVRVLIDGGSYINVKDSDGGSVLHIATKHNAESLLITLIRNTQHIEYMDAPLWSTWIMKGYFTLISQVINLIDKALLIELITQGEIIRCLRAADLSLVKTLYNNASKLVQTNVVERILHNAAKIQNKTVFEELVKHDISTTSSLDDGESLLSVLIKENNIEYCKIILQSSNRNIYVNKKDANQILPLHVCIENNAWDIIKQLIDNTTDIDHKDTDGNTPLAMMFNKGNDPKMKIIWQIIKHGADIHKKNNSGEDVISLCKNVELAKSIKGYYESNLISDDD